MIAQKRLSQFALFLLSALPCLAFADNFTLTPPQTDLSYQYLSNIFGVVSGVLHGSGSQIFGQMFNVFNSAVLALGGIVVTYTFMVSTLNTAGSGEVMGREWSSIWIPIKSAGGIALLLPKSTGYSTIQVFMMWVVVQGIGAADRLWETVMSYLAQGGVVIQQNATGATSNSNSPTGAMPSLGNIFLNTLCIEGMQNYNEARHKASTTLPPPPDLYSLFSTQIFLVANQYQTNQIQPSSQATSVMIGFPWRSNPASYLQTSAPVTDYNIGSQCGNVKIAIPAQGNSSGSPSILPLIQARLIALQQIVSDFQPAAQAIYMDYNSNQSNNTRFIPLGFNTCWADVNVHLGNPSQMAVCGNSSQHYTSGLLSPMLFQNAYSDYLGLVYAPSQALNTNRSAHTISANMLATAKRDGWLMAGTYYLTITQANNNANQFFQTGSDFPYSVTGFTADTNTPWLSSAHSLFKNPTAVNSINSYISGAMNIQTSNGSAGTTSQQLIRNVTLGFSAIAAAASIGAIFLLPILTGIVEVFGGMVDVMNSQQANMNPIVGLALMGGGMMNISVGFFITGAIIAFGMALGLGAVPCVDLSPAAVAIVTWFTPLLTGIIVAMFTTGALLAYYIPMIPYILFTFGTISWLIGIVEAMIAAPLVALGITHPEGNQALGKGEHAVMLTANVFLKPSLMIFGFIGGISISYVGIWILNYGFTTTFYNTINGILTKGTIIGSIFALMGVPLAMIIIYTILCITIVQRAFSLIHVVPDRVLRWIGGNIEGDTSGQMEQEVRGGVQKAYQTQGEGMGKGADQAFGEAHKEATERSKANRAGASQGQASSGGNSASLQNQQGGQAPGGAGAGGGQAPGGAGAGGAGGGAAGGGAAGGAPPVA